MNWVEFYSSTSFTTESDANFAKFQDSEAYFVRVYYISDDVCSKEVAIGLSPDDKDPYLYANAFEKLIHFGFSYIEAINDAN
mmetsp:Transcript_1586/g.1078  ORF Transcript_1586/g.1078 Transcript_1586/m.1078 type:complete len:82 (-) Transcript_1586:135-380(-)